jgi:hypothetical protein
MHSWSTFDAPINHGQTQIHKTHHGPDLGEATTFPFIIFFVHSHGACTQMSFCPRTPKLGLLKFSKLGLSQLWKLITSCVNLRLKWGLKKICACQKTFQWYVSCHLHASKLGQFLTFNGQSQIGILTPGFSFGLNLCFKYPNGSCKLIFTIYAPRAFQWYKDSFNPMSFDLTIALWRFKSPFGLQLLKWEIIWECEVHSLTLSYTPMNMKCDSRASFLAHTFASPYLGHKAKAKIATIFA